MKKIIFLSLILNPYFLISQKHNYVWPAGHDSFSSNANFGGVDIVFTDDSLEFIEVDRSMNFETGFNAAMSDKNGNLQFYSNGCYIANFENDTIENGANINPGYVHDVKCQGAESYGYTSGIQSGIALTLPDSEGVYLLFHKRIYYEYNPFNIVTDRVFYTVVDMNLNGGKGKVTLKNVVAIADSTLAFGDMTAVKHANGQDWWVISPGFTNNVYHVILVKKEGVISVTQQAIGDSTTLYGEGAGQSTFSPDGSVYVRFNTEEGIRMFDFDRVTGVFSNYQHINVDFGIFNPIGGGCAISPSGQYLYISARQQLYQFDLHADNVEASQELIGEWDGFGDPIPTDFGLAHAAPDCKIYIDTGNDSKFIHVIHQPNEPGQNCNFEQRGFQAPNYHGAAFPNFPDFRLSALGEPISPCAGYIVGSGEIPPTFLPAVSIFPNPVSEMLKILINRPLATESNLIIFNPYGQVLQSIQLPEIGDWLEVSTEVLSSGVYFYSVYAADKVVQSGKIIKK